MNVASRCLLPGGSAPANERALTNRFISARAVVAAGALGISLLAGLPATAAPNFPVLTVAPGDQTPPTAPRSTADGGNNVAKVVYIVNTGNNGINRADFSIQATTGPLTEFNFVDCSVNGTPNDCPADASGAIDSNGVFRTTFDVLPPGSKIGVLVVAVTPKSGDMKIGATVRVNNSTGGGRPLTTSDSFSIELGAATFSVSGYIPKARGQVTAQGLDPEQSSIQNALTTVVTIPDNRNIALASRLAKILHVVDSQSCSSMYAVCLHSGINVPDQGDPAQFSEADPLRVTLNLGASALSRGAQLKNAVLQYKATDDPLLAVDR